MLENCIHYLRLRSMYRSPIRLVYFNESSTHSGNVDQFNNSVDPMKMENFIELEQN